MQAVKDIIKFMDSMCKGCFRCFQVNRNSSSRKENEIDKNATYLSKASQKGLILTDFKIPKSPQDNRYLKGHDTDKYLNSQYPKDILLNDQK